ncbi:MAG: 7-carboxy-7-deazaguanine synthase QueE [Microcystaceae cyanobacterium]
MSTLTPTLTYPIAETFHSLQGEGAWTGVNAFFIRLGGCDVHCPWCDQKETWKLQGYPQQSSEELGKIAQAKNPAIVIITGGEPLMHNLEDLTQTLHQKGLKVHLETSGAYPLTGRFDWITLSPKRYKMPHPEIYSSTNELKVIIANTDDLLWAETEAKKVSPQTLIYLQPEWNSPHSEQMVFDYVLKHPQWRVSLQTHKWLGVR